MGKKRVLKDFWIIVLAIIGAAILVFGQSDVKLTTIGAIFIILSLVISLSKVWTKYSAK